MNLISAKYQLTDNLVINSYRFGFDTKINVNFTGRTLTEIANIAVL